MNQISELRTQRGLSRPQLAKAAGIDRHALSRWERGIRMPSITSAIMLAHALGVSVEDLGLFEYETASAASA
jgi:transcriptional regulator with XRE-family HTH domain